MASWCTTQENSYGKVLEKYKQFYVSNRLMKNCLRLMELNQKEFELVGDGKKL